jgi:long-subunit acyl-CoA synthetase (AMP-forming)
MREKEYGIWQTISWQDMANMVAHMACGLHQAGLKRGEHMVVVGSNRPRLVRHHVGGAIFGRHSRAFVPRCGGC